LISISKDKVQTMIDHLIQFNLVVKYSVAMLLTLEP
jgi:hypothetical protein